MEQSTKKERPGIIDMPERNPPGPVVGEMTMEELQAQTAANMSKEEVDAYINRILNAQNHTFSDPLENKLYKEFKENLGSIQKFEAKLNAITRETEELKILIQKCLGKQEFLVMTLIDVEQSRRLQKASEKERKQ